MGLVRIHTAGKLPDGVNLLAVFSGFGSLVKRQVKRNCREKGGRHFWSEVADATRVSEITEKGVTVENTHVAAAQKQHGGPIAAKVAKALTIPVDPMARGRRAGEFTQELFKVRTKEGKTLLGFNQGKGKKQRFYALYVLVKRTKPQRAFPFWPNEEEARKLLEKAVNLAVSAGEVTA